MTIFRFFVLGRAVLLAGVDVFFMWKSFIMRVFSVVCLVAVFFALVPGLCDGAEVGVKVKVPVDTRKIDVRYVRNKSGNRVSDRGGSSGGNKWARVAVTFDSFPEYIDELEVRYYLLCKDGKTMLTGSQVCMYVKRGRSHVTTIYAFPNAVEKFGGGDCGGGR